jgi:hypothetical protein
VIILAIFLLTRKVRKVKENNLEIVTPEALITEEPEKEF